MSDRWPKSIVWFHWAAALFVFGLAAAGLMMTGLPAESPARLLLSRAHTLGGLALMLLTLARLGARWRGPRPRPLSLAPTHRRGVAAVDALLYLVTLGLGASGVATSLGSDWPGYLRAEIATAPALGALAAREAHEVLAFVLLGLVGLHVAGVAVEQIRRGGVLRRMLPFLD